LKFIEDDKTSVQKEEKTVIDESPKIIAREIISEEKVDKTPDITPKTAKIEQKKEVNKETSSIVVNEKIKEIRINNAMATANLTYKKELTKLWDKLDSYFMDSKYGKVAQLLSDTSPMVVGTDNLILTSSSDGIMLNIYANLNQIEDFINNIYHMMKIVVLSNDEFDSVKNKYIEDKKNNITYQVLEEYDKLVSESNNLINQAINIFGSDMVDIE
jgi:hypothetical protein